MNEKDRVGLGWNSWMKIGYLIVKFEIQKAVMNEKNNNENLKCNNDDK